MTKKEIVKAISEDMDLTQLTTKEIVQKTFDAIVEALVTEGRIELRNFGVFQVKKRAARKARNPRTSERVDVEEKYVVTFKPGKEMEERVRQLGNSEEASPARRSPSLEPTTPAVSPGESVAGNRQSEPATSTWEAPPPEEATHTGEPSWQAH